MSVTWIANMIDRRELVIEERGEGNERFERGERLGIREGSGEVYFDRRQVEAALRSLGIAGSRDIRRGAGIPAIRGYVQALQLARQRAAEGNRELMEEALQDAMGCAEKIGVRPDAARIDEIRRMASVQRELQYHRHVPRTN